MKEATLKHVAARKGAIEKSARARLELLGSAWDASSAASCARSAYFAHFCCVFFICVLFYITFVFSLELHLKHTI